MFESGRWVQLCEPRLDAFFNTSSALAKVLIGSELAVGKGKTQVRWEMSLLLGQGEERTSKYPWTSVRGRPPWKKTSANRRYGTRHWTYRRPCTLGKRGQHDSLVRDVNEAVLGTARVCRVILP